MDSSTGLVGTKILRGGGSAISSKKIPSKTQDSHPLGQGSQT